MQPPPASQPLAPLDPHKTRALTTIYAPRKLKPRAHKTAQTRMLGEIPVQPGLSPFHPLPAIGQKTTKPKTQVIVLDLNKNERPGTMEDKLKVHDVFQPLTPLRIQGYHRKGSLEPLERLEKKPQQLLRENTYDVIEPRYVNAAKVKKMDSSLSRRTTSHENAENTEESEQKISPKSRFKQAALQVAKLTSMPETGKLLCLRERQTFIIHSNNEEDNSICRLQKLPQSPTQKLTKLTEIFQSLEMKGRHRDKMKKENSWF